jgi:ribonuclease BN (tRNA processing enzyme)
VKHPIGAPSMGLRFECEGKALAYTGDTERVDAIVDIGRGADLLIAEAYYYERKVPYHLDFRRCATGWASSARSPSC